MHEKENHVLSYLPGHMESTDWLRFVQLDPFARKWSKLKLTDDDLRVLEIAIMAKGDSAPVISGGGGLRKIRLSPIGTDQGKSGGFRVCYCLFPDHGIALLITVFGKNEKDNLSDSDLAAIAQLIRHIQEQLDKGKIS